MMRIYCLSHKHPAALFTFLFIIWTKYMTRLCRDFSRISFEYENVLNRKPTYCLCHEYLCKFLIWFPCKIKFMSVYLSLQNFDVLIFIGNKLPNQTIHHNENGLGVTYLFLSILVILAWSNMCTNFLFNVILITKIPNILYNSIT